MPLLALSLAAHGGWVQLSPSFAWLATTSAAVALATAMILEIAAYYVPFFDNMLDTLAAPVAVLALLAPLIALVVAVVLVVVVTQRFNAWRLGTQSKACPRSSRIDGRGAT